MKIDSKGRIIGCGYCALEKECSIHDPKVNKAAEGCPDYKDFRDIRDAKGRFPKGFIPWNKDKKGIHLNPETEFKPGQTAGEKSNMWKGGIQKMKSDCVHVYTGINKRARRPVEIYKAEYGPIPKGYIIYHIDGDKHNDNINNLEAISRAELLKRNLNERRYKKNVDSTRKI